MGIPRRLSRYGNSKLKTRLAERKWENLVKVLVCLKINGMRKRPGVREKTKNDPNTLKKTVTPFTGGMRTIRS
ncbi:MAG: hypothetical protein ACTSU5_17370 [Promethearchaeota archaeon]